MPGSQTANIELAKRYAKAAFSAAKTASDQTKLEKELSALAALYASSNALQRATTAPLVSAEEKTAVWNAIATKMKLSKQTIMLLNEVGKHGRLSLVPRIASHIHTLMREAAGQVEGTVTTALPLTAAQKKQLIASLKTISGKEVVLTEEVDAAILGGVVVRLGSTMIDHSLATHLGQLKQQLKHAAEAA